ncbi:MAG: substrate-binding domain-containing protein, partial [Cytophagales bacterium]|nr:substrate-binding domain-containing protein [Cytophagales bacterium]
MKRFVPYILIGFILSTKIYAQNTVLIKGSDTMLPFMRKIADTYSQKKNDTLIQVIGGGSGTGIEAIKNNSVTIAMSS